MKSRTNGWRITTWVAAMTLGSAAVLPAQTPPVTPASMPSSISWTSDRVSVREGDLITILIDEYTIATASRNESASNERGRNAAVGGSFYALSLRSANDISSRTRGESARRERFSAEITVRIVEILPGGNVRIEGAKRVQIDDHEQSVTVRGVVRTQDISVANTVESWRVADAELLYESNGSLGSVGGGIWSKLLNLIIP